MLLSTKQAKKTGQEESALVPRDEESWREGVSDRCWRTMQRLYALTEEEIGKTRIDYSGKNYVGLWKGRRCWCPMWQRQEGVHIYLPDGGIAQPTEDDPEETGGKDRPSARFAQVKAALAPPGIEASWAWTYNSGANPVAFALRLRDLDHPIVREVLHWAYDSVW